jgi:hypothetical protein
MTSQETVIETVLERLTKLERQNRRLKRTGVAALIVAASLTFMGQASRPKTVEANEFILRDANVMSHKFVHKSAGPCLGWQSASRSTQMVLDSHCGVVGNLEWPAPTRARE